MRLLTKASAIRLASCLFGGFVLALMVGDQEGTLTDFGISFHEAVVGPRIFAFLGIGVVVFLLISFWPLVVPYLSRPGVVPLAAGLVTTIAALTVMNWYDPLAGSNKGGKFSVVKTAADASPRLSSLSVAYFDWLAWSGVAATTIGCAAAVITRRRLVGYVVAAVSIALAVITYIAHHDVVVLGGGIDHSFGVYAAIIGFTVLGCAAISATHSSKVVADPRAFGQAVLAYRPGLPLAVLGSVLGLLTFSTTGWFGSAQINDTLAESHKAFRGTAISALASQYLSWLGWTLFGVCAAAAVVATVWRVTALAWLTAAVSLAGVVLTFFTLRSMTDVAARVAPQYGGQWKNLGVGGFVACIVFSLFGAAMAAVLADARRSRPARDTQVDGLPVHAMAGAARSANGRSLLIIGGALALFYPPTLTVVWQNVLVTQIGVFVLLAVGLNVVVGWAGLLDLGYIAFYEIGSYTTAYLVGALPVKPPSWLHMPVLLTIPFAIAACLIAGVLLGAPTLRLRGDYLAIVTLGFGEIIQIIAVNSKGFTGGPQGPSVPHPHLSLGFLHITWGQDNLPYWYLLLVLLVIVLVMFHRLEGSRLGRAWAAIREDEVAAQVSGVNTTRIKLLAFAIGASTSGLAGSFFASQVGYFDPSLFTLQASILIVAYVVFGGMGSLPGAIAGAAVLTWLPQFLKDQVPQNDRQMWVGALLLAMMIFRPAGLLPARRRKAELTGLGQASSAEVTAVPASEGI